MRDLMAFNPAGTFMIEDLMAVAYPSAIQMEKKHRVSIWRAVYNAIERDELHWQTYFSWSYAGEPYVLHNFDNLRSTGVAHERLSVWRRWRVSISDKEAEERCFFPQNDTYPYIVENSPWPLAVALRRAIAEDKTAEAEVLEREHTEACEKFDKHELRSGRIHADFLRDCSTVPLEDSAGESVTA